MEFMLKLRTILLSNYPYYITISLAIIYFLIANFLIKPTTKYKQFINEKFTIINITKKDYGIELKLKGKEKVLAKYYLEEKEIEDFLNNYNLKDIITITGEKLELTNNTVENTFNYKKYLNNQRIYNVVEINNIKLISKNKNIFYKIKTYLIKRSYKLEKSYPYINSLLLGNNRDIEEEVLSSYRANGISHLFAISGLHISIFSSILEKILKKLKVKEDNRSKTIIIFLIFYMFITNFTMSVMRGAIFNILLQINKIYYFHIKPRNLLILTLSIIIFLNPLYLHNIGLQFSFLISFFLITYSNLINKQDKNYKKLIMTSLISFFASYPITVNNFYEINLLSIVYNLVYVPYISTIVLPFTLISYIFPFLDNFLYILIQMLEISSQLLEQITIFKIILCKMPLLLVVSYYVSICLILSKIKNNNKKHYLLLLIIIIIHYFSPFNKENYLLTFDVGQGDSSLLSVNNTICLIDTGGIVMYSDNQYTYQLTNNKTIPYLKSKGIRKIDYLILTHGDYDHMGEAINLVENFKVDKVIFNCGKFNDLEKKLINVLDKKKIQYYSCIKELNIDDNRLYFLNNKDYGNENDNSSVIYTEFNNYKFLFMGDAGIEVEKDLIKKYNLQDIDVLKVGHHGSRTSSSKNFISEIDPKYSIISVGKNNRYGHPNKEVLENLNESKIYRTDQAGSIMFKIKNNKLNIETCIP